MGWENCGTDSKGRPIGYGHLAICDQYGCKAEIDRGLSYACGGMHGNDMYSCEKYFCGKHLFMYKLKEAERSIQLCKKCLNYIEKEEKNNVG